MKVVTLETLELPELQCYRTLRGNLFDKDSSFVADSPRVVGQLLERVENPLEVLEHYREVKHLFRELKEKLGIEKAGVLVYDIENSYPLSDEEGLERLITLIESETIWEKPVLAYSRCLEDTPIVKIYDMDKKEAYEPLAA